MFEHIPIYHSASRLDRLPRNKDLNLEISNNCEAVRKYLIIDWDGNCFICPCETWMPVSVGKIESFDCLEEVWNNPIAQRIQSDIDTKKFSWCAVDMCGIRNQNVVYDRYTISINIDPSCNLKCPSCRPDSIMLTEGREYDKKHQQARHLLNLLEKFNQPCHIIMSGNGDVLASNIMRPIVHEFKPRSTQTFRIFTNGLLIKKQLEKSQLLPQVTQYQISIDAGSPAVYERVRLGGRWQNLIENFDFLQPIAQKYQAEVWLMFVIQESNWEDIDNFAELAVRYGWSGNITKLIDWGTWDNFESHDVIGNVNHPNHARALKKLKTLKERKLPGINLDSALSSLV